MNIKREFKVPKSSFFLFGPRGTGKTTWLKQVLPKAFHINLLKNDEYLRYSNDPSLFRKAIEALPADQWVVVDEIQKLPALLDEVHNLLTETNQKRKFALTGSSARKLKRVNANMLAGRALRKDFFPISLRELGNFNLEEILQFGTLPMVLTAESKEEKIDFLEAYAVTYLKEEIQQEALVKNLDSFQRFLRVCGIMNGQILNLSNIGAESGITRNTVAGHFEILQDTLIATKLNAWQKKIKVKELSHPKFYLFDAGISRVLSGQHRLPLDSKEKGFLFETLIINEIRSFVAYNNLGGDFYYWASPPTSEVDLIWGYEKNYIGFEFKSSKQWKKKYSNSLNELVEKKYLKKAYGIYAGDLELKDGHVHVYPIQKFVKMMKEILDFL